MTKKKTETQDDNHLEPHRHSSIGTGIVDETATAELSPNELLKTERSNLLKVVKLIQFVPGLKNETHEEVEARVHERLAKISILLAKNGE